MDSVESFHQVSGDPPFEELVHDQLGEADQPPKSRVPSLIPRPSDQRKTGNARKQAELLDDVDLNTDCDVSVATETCESWNTLDNITALGLSFSAEYMPTKSLQTVERFSLEEPGIVSKGKFLADSARPFDKWMRTIHRKATVRRKVLGTMDSATIGDETWSENPSSAHHKKSSSDSSFGFVTAVRSASISLASFSGAARSRRTRTSSRQRRTDRSSKASNTGVRVSEDSSYCARTAVIDEVVVHRSVQRRRILEEIISTEEGYVGDIKFLMNVYATLLASVPSMSLGLRSSINRNLTDMIELHEELLGELHRVVPHSEYNQVECSRQQRDALTNCHQRWRSLDAVPEITDVFGAHKTPGMTADPVIAAEVAKVFGLKMHRFFAYEEYGAKYEMMVKDVASTSRTLPQWDLYQKGLEALAASLTSINIQNDHYKKSLTVGDLLVKPIQRVCRYPLLFAELLKQTPVCDSPECHMEIEKVLERFRETTCEINRVTDDPRMKSIMEKTWMLQDRLILPDQTYGTFKSQVRALGHIHLCGVLHVAWQTSDGVDSQYMISLLYRDCMILATAAKADQIYTVQASIGLSGIRVEEADNGRGLQCHTAPFSWKLVFEYDHQLYEVICSACTAKEELEWRSRLTTGACKDDEHAAFTTVSLEIRPMGTVFGKPGTIARKLSIQRATTVGPKSSLCQVVIKNTSVLKDVPRSPYTAINRSQSHLSSNRVTVLAPARVERIRLENLLADVWTRDILPFPGMTGRSRSEHLVRASASSVMRKLSVASITSNFTKRSGSLVSLTSFHRTTEDIEPENESEGVQCTYGQAWDGYMNESTSPIEGEDMPESGITFNQSENRQRENNPALMPIISTVNPVGTMKRLATLRKMKSLQGDGPRVITPPLRSVSGNSIRQPPANRSSIGGITNPYQPRNISWNKSNGRSMGFSAHGIKGIFK